MAAKKQLVMIRALVKMLAYAFIAWALGFGLFVIKLPSTAPMTTEKADAIVALTGGAGRLKAAVSLLENKKAKRLLISGVHKDVMGHELPKITGANPTLFECCVDLDYAADSTYGNARETHAWVQKHKYKSLIVVTANYHMPRSIALFRRAMPDMHLIPHPVQSDILPFALAREYNKYLFILVADTIRFEGS